LASFSHLHTLPVFLLRTGFQPRISLNLLALPLLFHPQEIASKPAVFFAVSISICSVLTSLSRPCSSAWISSTVFASSYTWRPRVREDAFVPALITISSTFLWKASLGRPTNSSTPSRSSKTLSVCSPSLSADESNLCGPFVIRGICGICQFVSTLNCSYGSTEKKLTNDNVCLGCFFLEQVTAVIICPSQLTKRVAANVTSATSNENAMRRSNGYILYCSQLPVSSDTLGQVSGEVDVQTLSNSKPVGHELERNDVEQTLQDIDSLGYLNLVGLVARELGVVLAANDDRATLASNDLLVCVEGLGEEAVTGKDHDNRQRLIDQRKHTVLELTRHDSLAVKVRDFLDLQGTLKSGGVLGTTAEKKQGLLVLELEAQVLDVLVLLKDLLELLRNFAETLHDSLPSGLLGCTVLTESSVDVNTAVGHHGNGRTDNVDNTDSQSTALETVAESHEGISGLTRLGDKDASVVTEDGSLSVEEVRGQFDRDGNLSQFLENTTNSHARTTQSNGLVFEVEATTHSVDDRLRLLEDLLLHEVVVTALHDLLELDLDGLDGTDLAVVDVSNIVVLEVENLLGVLDNGRRVGGQEELNGLRSTILGEECARLRAVEQALVRRSKEVVGLLQSDVLGGSFGRERASITKLNVNKVNLHLSLCADTNDQGRTLAGSDNLGGEVDGLEQKTKGALELLDDGLYEGGEVDVGVFVEDVLGQLGNGLSIGLGLEFEALGLEQGSQLLVVGDDTIVDDGELPLGVGSAWRLVSDLNMFLLQLFLCCIPVRVAVDTRRRTVGGPTSVSNTGVCIKDLCEVGLLVLDELLQLGDLADLLESVHLISLVSVDRQTS
ncbi:isomerising glucosamine-fructose-6-phosphate aminotransferase, partial [Aureobasidium melanogenum]